jgi:hypothetical protein
MLMEMLYPSGFLIGTHLDIVPPKLLLFGCMCCCVAGMLVATAAPNVTIVIIGYGIILGKYTLTLDVRKVATLLNSQFLLSDKVDMCCVNRVIHAVLYFNF